MKRLSFNRTHRIQSKSSSPIALIMSKRSDHSRTHFHRTCVVGLSARAFCAHCCMRIFAMHAQSGYRSACLTSSFAFISTAPPASPSTANPNGLTQLKPCPDFAKKWQKFAVVNGLSTPKRPQRCFVFTKPQVTIYRRQEQCTPYRAQPQICAKKLTIRTKYQARANCLRRHQQ